MAPGRPEDVEIDLRERGRAPGGFVREAGSGERGESGGAGTGTGLRRGTSLLPEPAGEQLPEQNAERVDIRRHPGCGRVGPQLRRPIGGGAGHDVGLVGRAGQPEVGDEDDITGEQHVLRLEIAVDEPGDPLSGQLHAERDLCRQERCLPRVPAPLGDDVAQGAHTAQHGRHQHEGAVLDLLEPQHGHDVRDPGKPGPQAHLAQVGDAHLRREEEAALERLARDGCAVRLARLPATAYQHLAHSAAADLQNVEVSQPP